MTLSRRTVRILDILSLACVLISLTACAHDQAVTPEPVITTIPVNKPVTKSCVPASVSSSPTYPDTQETLRAAAGSSDRFLQLLLAGRDQRDARLAEIEPVIEGCRK